MTWWSIPTPDPFSSILHSEGPSDHTCGHRIPVSKLHSHSSQMSTFWATGRPKVYTGEAQSTLRRADRVKVCIVLKWARGNLSRDFQGPGHTGVAQEGPVGSRSCVPLGLQTP